MIQTDGIRTIANPGPVPTPQCIECKRPAIAAGLGDLCDRCILPEHDNASRDLDILLHPNRGPQANGQDWSDGYCACGVAICDSPAGDKCWDCFNFDPS